MGQHPALIGARALFEKNVTSVTEAAPESDALANFNTAGLALSGEYVGFPPARFYLDGGKGHGKRGHDVHESGKKIERYDALRLTCYMQQSQEQVTRDPKSLVFELVIRFEPDQPVPSYELKMAAFDPVSPTASTRIKILALFQERFDEFIKNSK